ncbi:TRAP transporter small permease [Skermanella mucosa]|uniref:TRAP transporter small permease n=1 Tax=Skermanella mucosa TaxID=1789672 RepID=UPI00192B82E6|nr:TRAP transporter small permease [Skermanella mucosa]UEM19278.1 TRAP transporter small permease [Skermanella mucosa]
MIRIFLAIEGALNRVIGHAAAACLVVAAVSAFYQVVTRFVFEQPSTWSEALTRTCLIWMVFLGITIAFRHGALVAVDLAYRAASGPWRTALRGFITLNSIALLGVILWFGVQMAWRVRFQTLAGLEISIAWAYAALPVGAFFSLLAVIAHYLDRRDVDLEGAAG